jgi:DNA-directed RNA polymerase specialized sigma24 family protein
MIRRRIDLAGTSLERVVPPAGPTVGDWKLLLQELVEIVRRQSDDDVADTAELLMQGFSVIEIAEELEITPCTVRRRKETARGILWLEVVRDKSA